MGIERISDVVCRRKSREVGGVGIKGSNFTDLRRTSLLSLNWIGIPVSGDSFIRNFSGVSVTLQSITKIVTASVNK